MHKSSYLNDLILEFTGNPSLSLTRFQWIGPSSRNTNETQLYQVRVTLLNNNS